MAKHYYLLRFRAPQVVRFGVFIVLSENAFMRLLILLLTLLLMWVITTTQTHRRVQDYASYGSKSSPVYYRVLRRKKTFARYTGVAAASAQLFF